MTGSKILEVESLSKKYKTVQALHDITFSLEEGDIFAFLGPNGAGKTTTLRILLDIIKADTGSIKWKLNGYSGKVPNPALMGYLPEERGLYTDLPVIRSLVYLASIRGMKPTEAHHAAMEWLEKLELADRAKEKLQNLSKGNQQKVQFIASIIHKPAFAILDEPFSGLDPLNQEKFIAYIQELNQQGSTILLSSHQMPLVEKIARKVFLINNGQEVYNGHLSDIYKKYGQHHTLIVSFDKEPPIGQLKESEIIESIEIEESNRLRLTFAQGVALNQIMEKLSCFENLHTVKSENANLHDIFVSLVQNQKAN